MVHLKMSQKSRIPMSYSKYNKHSLAVERVHHVAERDSEKLSPIDLSIRDATVIQLPPLIWTNYHLAPSKLMVRNNGFTVMINAVFEKEIPYMSSGPLKGHYVFSQIHFHWGEHDGTGSGHATDGVRYPLEMHVVHIKKGFANLGEAVNSTDGIAVVVHLFALRVERNSQLDQLTALLQFIQKPKCCARLYPVSLSEIVHPFNVDYYVYWGAVGSPQGQYHIMWLISRNVLPISKQQIEEFRHIQDSQGNKLAGNSSRPQHLAGRSLFLVSPLEITNETMCGITHQAFIPEPRESLQIDNAEYKTLEDLDQAELNSCQACPAPHVDRSRKFNFASKSPLKINEGETSVEESCIYLGNNDYDSGETVKTQMKYNELNCKNIITNVNVNTCNHKRRTIRNCDPVRMVYSVISSKGSDILLRGKPLIVQQKDPSLEQACVLLRSNPTLIRTSSAPSFTSWGGFLTVKQEHTDLPKLPITHLSSEVIVVNRDSKSGIKLTNNNTVYKKAVQVDEIESEPLINVKNSKKDNKTDEPSPIIVKSNENINIYYDNDSTGYLNDDEEEGMKRNSYHNSQLKTKRGNWNLNTLITCSNKQTIQSNKQFFERNNTNEDTHKKINTNIIISNEFQAKGKKPKDNFSNILKIRKSKQIKNPNASKTSEPFCKMNLLVITKVNDGFGPITNKGRPGPMYYVTKSFTDENTFCIKLSDSDVDIQNGTRGKYKRQDDYIYYARPINLDQSEMYPEKYYTLLSDTTKNNDGQLTNLSKQYDDQFSKGPVKGFREMESSIKQSSINKSRNNQSKQVQREKKDGKSSIAETKLKIPGFKMGLVKSCKNEANLKQSYIDCSNFQIYEEQLVENNSNRNENVFDNNEFNYFNSVQCENDIIINNQMDLKDEMTQPSIIGPQLNTFNHKDLSINQTVLDHSITNPRVEYYFKVNHKESSNGFENPQMKRQSNNIYNNKYINVYNMSKSKKSPPVTKNNTLNTKNVQQSSNINESTDTLNNPQLPPGSIKEIFTNNLSVKATTCNNKSIKKRKVEGALKYYVTKISPVENSSVIFTSVLQKENGNSKCRQNKTGNIKQLYYARPITDQQVMSLENGQVLENPTKGFRKKKTYHVDGFYENTSEDSQERSINRKHLVLKATEDVKSSKPITLYKDKPLQFLTEIQVKPKESQQETGRLLINTQNISKEVSNRNGPDFYEKNIINDETTIIEDQLMKLQAPKNELPTTSKPKELFHRINIHSKTLIERAKQKKIGILKNEKEKTKLTPQKSNEELEKSPDSTMVAATKELFSKNTTSLSQTQSYPDINLEFDESSNESIRKAINLYDYKKSITKKEGVELERQRTITFIDNSEEKDKDKLNQDKLQQTNQIQIKPLSKYEIKSQISNQLTVKNENHVTSQYNQPFETKYISKINITTTNDVRHQEKLRQNAYSSRKTVEAKTNIKIQNKYYKPSDNIYSNKSKASKQVVFIKKTEISDPFVMIKIPKQPPIHYKIQPVSFEQLIREQIKMSSDEEYLIPTSKSVSLFAEKDSKNKLSQNNTNSTISENQSSTSLNDQSSTSDDQMSSVTENQDFQHTLNVRDILVRQEYYSGETSTRYESSIQYNSTVNSHTQIDSSDNSDSSGDSTEQQKLHQFSTKSSKDIMPKDQNIISINKKSAGTSSNHEHESNKAINSKKGNFYKNDSSSRLVKNQENEEEINTEHGSRSSTQALTSIVPRSLTEGDIVIYIHQPSNKKTSSKITFDVGDSGKSTVSANGSQAHNSKPENKIPSTTTTQMLLTKSKSVDFHSSIQSHGASENIIKNTQDVNADEIEVIEVPDYNLTFKSKTKVNLVTRKGTIINSEAQISVMYRSRSNSPARSNDTTKEYNSSGVKEFVTITSETVSSDSFDSGSERTDEDEEVEQINNTNENNFSPIRIDSKSAEVTNFPKLNFINHWNVQGEALLENNGRTLRGRYLRNTDVPFLQGGPLLGDYIFSEVHFHWGHKDCCGAEHIIDGQRNTLEAHFVHFKREYGLVEEALQRTDGIALVSVQFIVGGPPNPLFDGIVSNISLIREAGTGTFIPASSLFSWVKSTIDGAKGYFSYKGSMTAEFPCVEAVTWIIFPQPILFCCQQSCEFRKLKSTKGDILVKNFRSPQPLNNRIVYYVPL